MSATQAVNFFLFYFLCFQKNMLNNRSGLSTADFKMLIK